MEITVTCDSGEPMYWPLIDLVKQYARKPEVTNKSQTAQPATATPLPPELTDRLIANEGVQALLDRLGAGSKEFLRMIVDVCRKSGRRSFTIADLAQESGKQEKHIRANHRNVSKSMRSVGVNLLEKQWDFNHRCQIFTISDVNLNSLGDLV